MKLCKFFSKNICTPAIIISYISLIFLIMPVSMLFLLPAIIVQIAGSVFIFLKKPQVKFRLISISSFLISAAIALRLGLNFYDRWIVSAKVGTAADILHISPTLLTVLASSILAVCSIPFISGIFHQITELYITSVANSKYTFICNILFFLITSIITVILSQNMIDVDILSMGLFKFILGMLIVFIPILIIYCLTDSAALSFAVGSGIFMIISTVNVYVYSFRGRLFDPADIFSFTTAVNVMDNYSLLPIPKVIINAWCLWFILLFCLLKLSLRTKSAASLKKKALIASCCLIGLTLIFCYTQNLTTYQWQKNGAKNNGYFLDFVCKFNQVTITKPNDYSNEYIDSLSDQYKQNTGSEQSEHPHIIVIMNEAFSDLSVIGDVATNKEVTPFISSLEKEAVSGYALTSVFGGNTANSEFEFLTGNSMAWLSPNSVPYQQYLKEPSYSMVSHLKTYYDYHCIAMHPYLSSGWNRPNVYTDLGFDEIYFQESFPQENYVRRYISDQEMFETIVDMYENNSQDPLFFFGVSMQNHGNYYYTGDDFNPSISLVGYDNDYPDVEQYLSLLNETDKAVEYLISYFQAADEDVVIVFFGDHQPRIDENFYNEISSSGFDSLNDQQKKYLVPFFIWSNYDMDAKHIECTSLNYLSSYVYEAAGISLPPYNQFLSEIEETIPSINANGFYSSSTQGYLPFDMANEEEQELLQLYEQLQYNNLFDSKNRNENLFPVLE